MKLKLQLKLHDFQYTSDTELKSVHTWITGERQLFGCSASIVDVEVVVLIDPVCGRIHKPATVGHVHILKCTCGLKYEKLRYMWQPLCYVGWIKTIKQELSIMLPNIKGQSLYSKFGCCGGPSKNPSVSYIRTCLLI